VLRLAQNPAPSVVSRRAPISAAVVAASGLLANA
jgi:hypothetical protein